MKYMNTMAELLELSRQTKVHYILVHVLPESQQRQWNSLFTDGIKFYEYFSLGTQFTMNRSISSDDHVRPTTFLNNVLGSQLASLFY